MTDQLAFDLDAGARAERDLVAQVRALVAEPGMSDDEISAVVEDALGELGWRLPPEAGKPKRCECVHVLVLPHDRGDSPRCHWCGRTP